MRSSIIFSFAVIISLFGYCDAASAQSFPSWLQYGTVGTAGQWQSAFQSKQDVLPFTPCNIAGCSLTGELFLSPSNAGRSGLNFGIGSSPSLPAAGDLWATSGAFWFQGATPGLPIPFAISAPPPTASGTCAIGSQLGTNATGSFIASAPCAAGTVIFTFANTAPNGWACTSSDLTTPTDLIGPTAYTQTSITFTGTLAAADLVTFSCTAF